MWSWSSRTITIAVCDIAAKLIMWVEPCSRKWNKVAVHVLCWGAFSETLLASCQVSRKILGSRAHSHLCSLTIEFIHLKLNVSLAKIRINDRRFDSQASKLKVKLSPRRGHTHVIRDMKINQQEQPFLFWGSVVALLFEICTVIQTVTSVWSLQLALTAS